MTLEATQKSPKTLSLIQNKGNLIELYKGTFIRGRPRNHKNSVLPLSK